VNSRERVRAALNFREPDRVPVDLGGTNSSGITVAAYAALKEQLCINTGEVLVHDVAQMLATVEAPVRERLGVDVVGLPNYEAGWGEHWNVRNGDSYRLWTVPGGPDVMVPSTMSTRSKPDGSTLLLGANGQPVAQMPAGGHYFDPLPGADSETVPEPEDFSLPGSLPREAFEFYHRTAENLYRETDCAVLGAAVGYGLFFLALGGFENWLCAIMEQPDKVGAILDRAVECNIPVLEMYNQATGGYVEAVMFADDLGTQDGEWLSPDIFRELFAPRYKRIFDWIHEHTDLKVFFHCCGSIPNLIETLIECGVDILNPVQTSAAGMDPRRLKDRFGGRVVFWGGGVDTQSVLPRGSLEEIESQVKERIGIFAPGGGFVFNPVHNIQPGVSPERILACFDSAKQFGAYPVAP
jgi:uroporphyrinogen decarboxylase